MSIGTGVLAAAYHSFANHLPLALKPDHFWALVLLGVGQRASMDSTGAMQAVFSNKKFDETGEKVELVVHKLPLDSWEDCLVALEQNLYKIVNDRSTAELVTATYSTTTESDLMAFRVALMDVAHHYVKLSIVTSCGIPQVTLLGSPADWIQLQKHTFELLHKTGMEWWYTELEPYLNLFVGSFATPAAPDITETWQSFFKYKSQSGGNHVGGWINAFYPFTFSSLSDVTLRRNHWFALGEKAKMEPDHFGGVPIRYVPQSQSKVPLNIDKQDCILYGGFTAPGQDLNSNTIMPQLGWALTCPNH